MSGLLSQITLYNRVLNFDKKSFVGDGMEPKRWLNLDKINVLSIAIFQDCVRFLFFQFEINFLASSSVKL